MNTCQILATELDIDEDLITALAWDIACLDEDLTTDYDRFLAFSAAAALLAGIEISNALVTRIKDALDAVVAP